MENRGLRLRKTFAAFPTGVTVIAATRDGAPKGMVAASFVPVSLEPPLVSLCLGRNSTTWPVLRHAPRLGISVLGAHHEATARQIGASSGDRFNGVGVRGNADGAVFVEGAAAWFDCVIEAEIPAGDHRIVLFEILDLGADDSIPPLVFHGSTYRMLQPAME